MEKQNHSSDTAPPKEELPDRTLPSANRDSAIQPSLTELGPGEIIDGRFKVISVLGKGGFGTVYKVQQILLKKELALKTLNPMQLTDVMMLRLKQEGQTASKLEHRNLVKAYDFGIINGNAPYLVMEYLEGPTLQEYQRAHSKLSIERALNIYISLCVGLAYAHRQNVIHRDMKPSNVILAKDDEGVVTPKIVDFGIAKIRQPEESQALTLTRTGEVFGTPLYMSPEQCMGEPADARSDIYSLGCMLFESLAGVPPFTGQNPLETMMQHYNAEIPTLKEASLGQTYPDSLEKVVAKMLAKEPECRYQSCSDVADDLFAYSRGELDRMSIAQPKPTQSAARFSKTQIALALFVVTTIGIVIVNTVSSSWHQTLPKVTPGNPITAKAPDSAPVIPFAGFPDDADRTFYSEFQGNKRVFRFPPGHLIGQLHWWTNKDNFITAVASKQPAEVPKNAKLILQANREIMEFPYLLAGFRSSELYGIMLEVNGVYYEEDAIANLMNLATNQSNVQLLRLDKVAFTPTAFMKIEQLSNLRWLEFQQCQLFETRINGDTIAKLKNLSKLKVLIANNLVSPTPILKKLVAEQSPLERLSLDWAKELSSQDVKLIAKLPNLKTLSLANTLPADINGMFDELAKSKSLTNLRVHNIPLPDTYSHLRKIKSLKRIALDVPEENTPEWNEKMYDEAKQKAKAELPHIEILDSHPNKQIDALWFNPLAEDVLDMH